MQLQLQHSSTALASLTCTPHTPDCSPLLLLLLPLSVLLVPTGDAGHLAGGGPPLPGGCCHGAVPVGRGDQEQRSRWVWANQVLMGQPG